MAAIGNINNNNLRIIMPRPNVQNVQAVDAKIAKVDRGIESNNKLIELYKEKKDKLENLINSNEKYIQTLQDSKELDKKRIDLMEKQIDLLRESKEIGKEKINLLYQLLENRNSRRETTVSVLEIKTVDIKSLDKKLDTLAKKESILKEQSIAVDTKVMKLTTKIEHFEKQIATLEAKTNDNEISKLQDKQDKTVFTSGYKPSANQLIELSKSKQESQDIDVLNTSLQQRVIYSQQNIYESIINNCFNQIIKT